MKKYEEMSGKTLKKWYTTAEYIDQETGEVITKKKYLKEYYKTKTIRKIEIHENYGIIKYQHECRNLGQARLWE